MGQVEPVDKNIANDYRKTMGTSGSPSFIDSDLPITPVAIINNGLPVQSTKQRLKTATVQEGTTGQTTIATATAKMNIYFLGVHYRIQGTGGFSMQIYDATSGASPALSTTPRSDHFIIFAGNFAAAADGGTHFLPMPIKANTGIRVQTALTTGNPEYTIYYLEEDV